jgi:hypothetical protein
MNLKKIDISILLLLVFAVLLHIFSGNSNWIEHHYSNGLFLTISNLRCLLFGKLGFSFGDIIYGVAFFAMIFYFTRFIIVLFQKKIIIYALHLMKAYLYSFQGKRRITTVHILDDRNLSSFTTIKTLEK